jgi:hypothetical protein
MISAAAEAANARTFKNLVNTGCLFGAVTVEIVNSGPNIRCHQVKLYS